MPPPEFWMWIVGPALITLLHSIAAAINMWSAAKKVDLQRVEGKVDTHDKQLATLDLKERKTRDDVVVLKEKVANGNGQ